MAKVATITHNVGKLLPILRALDKNGKKQLRGLMTALAEPIFQQTQERVPVKKGDLKASGRISVRVGAKQITLAIKYGNDRVLYAARIENDLELKHPNGGQAKYVESVVRTFPFAEEVARRIDLRWMLGGQ